MIRRNKSNKKLKKAGLQALNVEYSIMKIAVKGNSNGVLDQA